VAAPAPVAPVAPARPVEPALVPAPTAAPPAPALVAPAVSTQPVAASAHAAPVYKKWWLWTVVGVVVAGAAVGGALAATVPKDASIPAGAYPVHFPAAVSTP